MAAHGSLLDQHYRSLGPTRDPLADLEDVEMAWYPEEVGRIANVVHRPRTDRHQGAQLHYICIDTNVLLARLDLVKQLYSLLTAHTNANISLLVPHRVLRELDTQGSAETGPTSDQARAATAWLLTVIRRVMTEGVGSIRHQKTAEKNDPSVCCDRCSDAWQLIYDQSSLDPDDLILDCCLFFKQARDSVPAHGVTLWTNDTNLSAKAWVEEIPAVGGRATSLRQVLEATRMPLSEALLHATEPSPPLLPSSPGAGDMDLDPAPDTVAAPTCDALPASITTGLGPSSGSTPMANGISPATQRSAPVHNVTSIDPDLRLDFVSSLDVPGLSIRTLRQKPPPALLANLAEALFPIVFALQHLPIIPTDSTAPIGPDSASTAVLAALIRHMNNLYEHITADFDPNDQHALRYKRLVSQCEGNFRKIRQFAEPAIGRPRTRSGDAADALDALALALPDIVPIGMDLMAPLSNVAIQIRTLD